MLKTQVNREESEHELCSRVVRQGRFGSLGLWEKTAGPLESTRVPPSCVDGTRSLADGRSAKPSKYFTAHTGSCCSRVHVPNEWQRLTVTMGQVCWLLLQLAMMLFCICCCFLFQIKVCLQ